MTDPTIRAHARAHVKELTARTTELVGEVIANGMISVLEECIAMHVRIQELEAELARRTQPEATAPAADPIIQAALQRDHDRAVRAIKRAAEFTPEVDGLTPENAIDLLSFKLCNAAPAQKLTLENAPIGTKAPATMGGAWTRTELGWKWDGGSTFPRPGGDWNGDLIAPAQDLSAAILALPLPTPKFKDVVRGGVMFEDSYSQEQMRELLKSAAALASSANALSAGDRVDAGEQIKEILNNLQRWELDCGDMIEHATGGWVNYWDIHPIIFAPEGEAVAAILQSQKGGRHD